MDMRRGIRRLLIVLSVAYWAVALFVTVADYRSVHEASLHGPWEDYSASQFLEQKDPWEVAAEKAKGNEKTPTPDMSKLNSKRGMTYDEFAGKAPAKAGAEVGPAPPPGLVKVANKEALDRALADLAMFGGLYVAVGAIVAAVIWVVTGFRKAKP